MVNTVPQNESSRDLKAMLGQTLASSMQSDINQPSSKILTHSNYKMPSRTEQSIPSFPTDIPTANISSVDYNRLLDGDQHESQKVFDAARGYGFFYLSNANIDADFMFDLANETFKLPLDEKMKFEMGSTGRYFGYKMSGSTIVDSKGTPDCVSSCSRVP